LENNSKTTACTAEARLVAVEQIYAGLGLEAIGIEALVGGDCLGICGNVHDWVLLGSGMNMLGYIAHRLPAISNISKNSSVCRKHYTG
jgi:hypothetical protein